MTDFPKISPLGDRAILIEFEPEINENVLEKVLTAKEILQNSKFKQKVEIINTYNSLLISYAFTIEDFYGEFLRLKELISRTNISKKSNYKIFHLPVCYDEDFGLDLETVSEKKNLSVEEIIRLHNSPIYQIYFIGFLPGFLYLGGLDEKLKISRRKTPRKSIEKGSVGIGENQTGIYPKNSPGGWQILGKTPVELFNKNEDNPSPFSAGDKIKFSSILKEEYYEIKEKIQNGNYKLKYDQYES